MSTESGRHLTPQALMTHWNSGVPVLIPVKGEPVVYLRVDAREKRLSLRIPIPAKAEVPPNTLTHIEIVVKEDDGQYFLEITMTDERLLIDGYTMFCSISDRIQLDGAAPIDALEDTLTRWHSILAIRTRMSHQAEVGLFGELLVLEALLADRGDVAIEAWKGTSGEEHDFGFMDADVEIKTTTGERRHHWIHGLNQLLDTPPTPLWLLSIQITRGGLESGRTLGALIDDVLSATTDAPTNARLQEMLTASLWRQEDDDLFSESWRLRTAPLALHIDETFPRLTSERLTQCGVSVAAIRQVDYEIDVTDYCASDTTPPSSIRELLKRMEIRT